MKPTLLVGDHILVSKFIYGIKVPYWDKTIIPVKNPQWQLFGLEGPGIPQGHVFSLGWPDGENRGQRLLRRARLRRHEAKPCREPGQRAQGGRDYPTPNLELGPAGFTPPLFVIVLSRPPMAISQARF